MRWQNQPPYVGRGTVVVSEATIGRAVGMAAIRRWRASQRFSALVS